LLHPTSGQKKNVAGRNLPYITNKKLGNRCSEPRGGEVLQRDQSCKQYAKGKESNMKYTEDAELSNGNKVTN
jgi:hypothetical protein